MRVAVVVLCILLLTLLVPVSAASAEPQDVNSLAVTGGTVTGYVDNGNTSVPGATVTLVGKGNESGPHSYSTASTSPLGFYTVTDVAPGTYYATADKTGYNMTPTNMFDVEEGATTWVNITLADHPTWLTGKVTYGNAPVEGVLVTLVSEGGTSYTKVTDDQGNYAIQVPSGDYTITFSKSGYAITELKKTLLPQQNNGDVVLKKSVLPGNAGFIQDYDLAHSMMIVGLFLALVTLVSALALRFKVGSRPEILEKPAEEKK